MLTSLRFFPLSQHGTAITPNFLFPSPVAVRLPILPIQCLALEGFGDSGFHFSIGRSCGGHDSSNGDSDDFSGGGYHSPALRPPQLVAIFAKDFSPIPGPTDTEQCVAILTLMWNIFEVTTRTSNHPSVPLSPPSNMTCLFLPRSTPASLQLPGKLCSICSHLQCQMGRTRHHRKSDGIKKVARRRAPCAWRMGQA